MLVPAETQTGAICIAPVSKSQFISIERLPAISTTTTAAATTAAATTATATTAAAVAAAAAVVTAAAAAAAVAPATTTATVSTVAAATTAIATAAAAAAVAAATAAAALLALLGLVNAERAPVEGPAVHTLDGLRGLLGGTHGHECKTARAARLTIRDEVDVADRSELLERSTDAISIGIERKISNIQTSVHRLLDLAL